jgi:hypothetical protein
MKLTKYNWTGDNYNKALGSHDFILCDKLNNIDIIYYKCNNCGIFIRKTNDLGDYFFISQYLNMFYYHDFINPELYCNELVLKGIL